MSDWGQDLPAPAPGAESSRAAVAAAQIAQDRFDSACEALADAEGALRVAQAKVSDYESDEARPAWQVVAAHEELASAERAKVRYEALVGRRGLELQRAHAEAEDATAAAEQDASDDATQAPGEPRLYYGSVEEFVREYLVNVYRRTVNGRARVWAARWWEHNEAIIRLEALWRSWEHLRLDAATGMSVWLRDHADHHMGVLLDPDGPFAGADPNDPQNQNRRGEPLPYAAAPPGLFPDVRNGA